VFCRLRRLSTSSLDVQVPPPVCMDASRRADIKTRLPSCTFADRLVMPKAAFGPRSKTPSHYHPTFSVVSSGSEAFPICVDTRNVPRYVHM